MSKYRIQTVAQLTGLSPALIRAWEARYRLVVPQRSPSGYRLYSDEDVAVLQGAQRLVASGMAPMQVATLDRAELLRSRGADPPGAYGQDPRRAAPAGRGEARPAPRPAPDSSDDQDDDLPPDVLPSLRGRPPFPAGAEPPPRADRGDEPFGDRIDDLIAAFAAFDASRAEQLLGPPLAVLPPEVACARLLLPLLREVGERWHRGALSVAAEHFGTSLVRSKILTILESLRRKPGARRVVCACPPGEMHEMGLLLFTLTATVQGWETIYLGANLPLFDLLDVVNRTRPELVAISVVQRLDPPALCRLLGEALALLGGRTRLLVGGRGVEGMHDLVRQMGGLLLPDSGRLDDLLGAAV